MIAENIEKVNIILKIPKGAVKLAIDALMLDNEGNPYPVTKYMSAADIADARKDFLDNVELGDDFDKVKKN